MSMDIENKEKADKLAQEILRLSRNTLLVNLRFLDMALSRLKHSPAGDSLAVNGIRIFYDPMWVLRRYKGERNAIVRDYLHMVFHCIFHHAFVSTLVDTDAWDLACDIAAENAISELVNSMVTLSRMDEEESPLRMKEFDISAAAEETAGSFSDFALSRGHELSINVEQGISYRGDEYAVRQLVSILLDNAVKYAADATPISIELRRARKGVILCAENTCVSPENIEADKLFDRFYRADKSRSESGSGFGIGLSIARSIAEGHSGCISAKINGDRIVFEAELK